MFLSILANVEPASKPAGTLTPEAAKRISDVYTQLPGWIPNPFVALIILVLVTLVAVVWLGLRQKQIAENQTNLAGMLQTLDKKLEDVLDELDQIE